MYVFKIVTPSERTETKTEVTRWVVKGELAPSTWEDLVNRLKKLFNTRSSQFFVSWFDGTDYCTVRDYTDLQEAVDFFVESDPSEKAVRIFVSPDKREHHTIFGVKPTMDEPFQPAETGIVEESDQEVKQNKEETEDLVLPTVPESKDAPVQELGQLNLITEESSQPAVVAPAVAPTVRFAAAPEAIPATPAAPVPTALPATQIAPSAATTCVIPPEIANNMPMGPYPHYNVMPPYAQQQHMQPYMPQYMPQMAYPNYYPQMSMCPPVMPPGMQTPVISNESYKPAVVTATAPPIPNDNGPTSSQTTSAAAVVPDTEMLERIKQITKGSITSVPSQVPAVAPTTQATLPKKQPTQASAAGEVRTKNSYVAMSIQTLRSMGFNQDERDLKKLIKQCKGNLNEIIDKLQQPSNQSI